MIDFHAQEALPIVQQELRELLNDALATISKQQRDIFLMRFLHGMTFKEIKRRKRLKEGQAQTICLRAKVRLLHPMRRRQLDYFVFPIDIFPTE